ncbi:MAG: Phage shock protein (PspC) family protein [Nocardioides sp.]|nr:Phage shock protein (PspC) family protein [Nocardioides sp.]
MSTLPPEAPPEPGAHDAPPPGPRVTRDDVSDLARLRRSRNDRKIGGVAAGLARHFDVDPIIPRVLLVVLVFFGGAGILLYAAAWLIVPVEGTDEAVVRLDDRSRKIALLVVGAVSGLTLLGDSLGQWGLPWPIVVAGIVVLIVLMVRGGEPRLHPFLRESWVTPTPPPMPGAPVPPPYAVGKPERSGRRRGPVLFWYALALIALGTGVLGIVDIAGADVADSAYPAVALGTCAALLLLGAFWGRAGGLILLGLISAVATAGATAAGEVDAGSTEVRPTSATSLADRYDYAFGEIEVDLTRITDLEGLDGRTLELEVDVAGRIEVVVPDGVDVVVLSSIEEGEVRVFGDRLGDGAQRTVLDGGTDAPELTIDASVKFGEIEIIREGTTR